MNAIPFNRPYAAGSETAYMKDALDRGHLSGDGFYTRAASKLLAEITGVDRVLLTTSCTHALEMAAMLLELREGDEVIMPSFTFVSTANAVALRGARPVFVDIRRDTFNIDERLIEARITDRTKAIFVVHYAGVACDMTAIMRLADSYQIPVVEDNAHGFGGTYQGRPLGSFGALSTLSFHETKNVQCGEGGALVVSDDQLWERAEIIREKGTDRSRFFRGQVDKYTWVELGSSYLPSDLLAAFLTAQLESFADIQVQRMTVWNAYSSGLGEWSAKAGFTLPLTEEDSQHPAHLFAVLAPTFDARQKFIAHMAKAEIGVVFHYVPLHSAPVGRRYDPDLNLPETDYVSERLARLPLYAGLAANDVERVISRAVEFIP